MDTLLTRLTSLRVSGRIGMGAAVLFIVMLIWEFTAGLAPSMGPMSGARLWNQLGFLLAMIGYLIMLAGIHRARVSGSGRFGRLTTASFIAAWTLLALCSLLTAAGLDQDDNPILPVAALLLIIGSLLTGIAVARAGRWRSWQRWWPLALALYWPISMIATGAVAQEPTFTVEALWALSYFGLGAASVTADRTNAEDLSSSTDAESAEPDRA